MGTHHQQSMHERQGAIWLAGEASGDFLASLVIPEVSRRMGSAPQYGVGGTKMRNAGLCAWNDSSELAVRGYMEVLTHLPRLMRLRSSLTQRFVDSMPQVFVGVDAPDFNLGVETALRRQGLPVVHMVSPSIWAWRKERIHAIRRAVDHMLLVFPFEEALYKKAGIPATYIGHPLAGVIPLEPNTQGARDELGVEKDVPVLTVLPGSRVDEVSGCGPIFFSAVEKLMARVGKMAVLIAAVDDQRRTDIVKQIGAYPRLAQAAKIVVGQSHRLMEAADVVLVASGTAALEAALFKKPMVVGYKMPAITGLLMQGKSEINAVSLPNILLKDNVVPECLQFFCTDDIISHQLEAQFEGKRNEELRDRFTKLHLSLIADTPNLAADVILDLANRS